MDGNRRVLEVTCLYLETHALRFQPHSSLLRKLVRARQNDPAEVGPFIYFFFPE